MQHLVRFFVLVVAIGLTALTVKGAYALTGLVSVTAVLSSLVVLQWACAGGALRALRDQRGVQWRAALGLGTLWLGAATVTVSFVGAELFEIFAARDAASSRFDAEVRRVTERAREMEGLLQASGMSLEQYAQHARQMAQQEDKHGGSCAVSRGLGTGEIHAFRQVDANSAGLLVAQAAPQIARARQLLAEVGTLRFEGSVGELKRALDGAAATVNSLAHAPLAESMTGFVVSANQAAGSIRVSGQAYRCDDGARDMLLQQIKRHGEALKALPRLAEPDLLDHNNSRLLAQGTLVRTWTGLLELLPAKLWGGRQLVSASFRERFAVEDRVVLSASNMPLVLAWLLEFVLIGLIAVTGRVEGDAATGAVHTRRLGEWLRQRLVHKGGTTGSLVSALSTPLSSEASRPPYVDESRLFADKAMQERAASLAPWYRPWGALEILAIPVHNFIAFRAARELMHMGVLAPLAWEIETGELLRDPQLARVMRAVGDPAPQGVWDVYRITSQALLRWLLTQPVDAQHHLRRVQ